MTACAAPPIPLPFAKQPVITPEQARVTFLRLESERTVALGDESQADLARIETGQALANDLGEMESGSVLGSSQDLQGTPFTTVRMLVPRFTSYPAWFAVETWEPDQRALDVVARSSTTAPWRLQLEALPSRALPRIKEAAGYATAVPFDRNVSSDLVRYLGNGLADKPTQFLLTGPYTSGEVSLLLKSRSSLQSSGWSVGSTWKAGPFPLAEGLALQGGGELGVAAFMWTVSVSTTDGSCFWQDPKTSYWTNLGTAGATAQLTYTREVSAPVIESKAGERVMGWNQQDIRASRQPC